MFLLARFVHLLGLSAAVGGAVGSALLMAGASKGPGREEAASQLHTKLELPGIFVAIFGGVLLVVANPRVFSPSESGAGPWLHVKLLFVLGALVLAHVKMFNGKALLSARVSGRAEECAARQLRGLLYDRLALASYIAVFILVSFRYLIFA